MTRRGRSGLVVRADGATTAVEPVLPAEDGRPTGEAPAVSQRPHSHRRDPGPVSGTGDQLPGAISLVDEDGVPVLRLCGEIDSTVVDACEDATGDRPRQAAVIDASQVTFLDRRRLGLLVRRTQDARCAGQRPVLRGSARIVRRVVDIAGAGGPFTIAL